MKDFTNMMNRLLLIFFLTLSNTSICQDTTFFFFDSDWKKCDQSSATFYRKLYRNDSKLWMVEDYYMSNSQIQMSGSYLKKNLKKQQGRFAYYYENGQMKSEQHFEKNVQTGKAQAFFANGQQDFTGSYKNGKKHGEWLWYHKNGQLSSKESYYYGNPKNIEQWDSLGQVEPDPVVWIDPQYPGGDAEREKFIIQNVIYPEEALKKGQRGEVWIKFVVNKDGSLSDFQLIKASHDLLNEAALSVVKKMPNWIPGKFHNRAVRVSYTLPIAFRL